MTSRCPRAVEAHLKVLGSTCHSVALFALGEAVLTSVRWRGDKFDRLRSAHLSASACASGAEYWLRLCTFGALDGPTAKNVLTLETQHLRDARRLMGPQLYREAVAAAHSGQQRGRFV